jgi:four helix bundle protein
MLDAGGGHRGRHYRAGHVPAHGQHDFRLAMTNSKFQMTNKSVNYKSRKYDIRDRALEFAARVAVMISQLSKNPITIEYGKQLIRSSASIGANLEEADGTLTKKDFINKMAIGRREARESRYWLRLIKSVLFDTNPHCQTEIINLEREAEEIMLILSSIINKTKAKNSIK